MSTRIQTSTAARTPGIKMGIGLLAASTVTLLSAQFWATDVHYGWHRVIEMRPAYSMFSTSRVAIVQKGDMLFAAPTSSRMLWIDVGTYVCTSQARAAMRRTTQYRVESPARCRHIPKPLPPLSPGKAE